MSLQGTFNTAVQAMNSQTQFLNNISTNIANVNTTGYKAQDTHFATLLNHVAPGNKSFFTVNTFDNRNVDKQGTIATTNRGYDIAVNGRGMLVTNSEQDGSGRWQYTRDGALFGKAVELTTDTDGDGQNDQGTLFTTANGAYVMGWAADANGTIAETNSLGALTPIAFNSNAIVDAKQTTSIELQANLSTAESGRQHVGLPFVDQDGHSRTLDVGFTATLGTNEFTLDFSSVDANLQPVSVFSSPTSVNFDSLGKISSPSNGIIQALVLDSSGSQVINLDLSRMTQLGQDGDISVQNIEQNGYLSGRLDRTYFTKEGVLVGSYSNGEVRNLYKLPIATFDADNNLEAKSGNVFEQTADAGSLNLRGIGSGSGRTELIVGGLETSTVDLTDQFAKMIVTQRAYSSAATVLRTADEMTQAARDLKR